MSEPPNFGLLLAATPLTVQPGTLPLALSGVFLLLCGFATSVAALHLVRAKRLVLPPRLARLFAWTFALSAPIDQPLNRQSDRQNALRRLIGEDVSIPEDERELLGNVLGFGETVAREVMVPRPDVVWLSTEHTLEQVMARVNDSGHSRFPICEGSPDRVIGYLHARDLPLARTMRGPFNVRRLVRPVAFVPETARAMSILRRFQQTHAHLAVVVDEFGGMAGVVALEDLLEELVGEIQDEFDVEEPDIEVLETGEHLVAGGVQLEELESLLGIGFGDAQEETLGGFMFGQLAREVHVGDELAITGAVLRAEAVEGLRVTRVRVTPILPETELEVSADLEITAPIVSFIAMRHAESRSD